MQHILQIRVDERRLHDDRSVVVATNLAQERDAIHARHLNIRDDEVEALPLEVVESLEPVFGAFDLVPAAPQFLHHRLTRVQVIVYDQDVDTCRLRFTHLSHACLLRPGISGVSRSVDRILPAAVPKPPSRVGWAS